MNTFKQDLNEDNNEAGIYIMHLYFKEEPTLPKLKEFHKEMSYTFGLADVVSKSDDMYSFALGHHRVEYESGSAPIMLLLAKGEPLKHPIMSDFDKSQFWDVQDGATLAEECNYQIICSDMMASGLNYLERADILMDFLHLVLKFFPECCYVYFDPSRKLLSYESALNNPYEGARRILWGGCNARFFNIQDSDDALVDTLGLNIFGIADIQYHFKNTVDVNAIIGHAYNLAIYQFENNMPINSNETVDGISGESWLCEYEAALIQPPRQVLDVNLGEFAAGNRE